MMKSQPRPNRSWKHSALALSIVAGTFAIPSPVHATHLRRIAVDLPPGPDLKVTKTVTSVDQALGIVIYSITVSNIGSVAAPGPIKLTDLLPSGPAGVTFVGFSGTFGSGSCASVPYSTGPVVCTQAAALPAGASLTVSIHIKVPMPTGGTVKNCASATQGQAPGTPSDVNPANNINICATPVVFGVPVKPDLQITKTGVVTGPGVITYTITVKNIGTAPAPGPIVMTDQLPTAPAGVSFQGYSGTFGSGPGTCTAPNSGFGPVVCTQPGPLAPGASQVANVVVHVPATGGSVSNCADVSGAANPTTPGDPNLANNHACSVPITIAPTSAPDLQVTKTASLGANGGITYTLTITNVGGAVAPAPIIVYDTLVTKPAGTHFTGAGGTGGFSCPGAGNAAPWTCTSNSPIGPGASVTLLISVTVPKPPGGSVLNCARVKAPTGDPVMTNNRSCVSINVQ